jgi:DNA-directed RNA polymerase subunit RPC12/RpoP
MPADHDLYGQVVCLRCGRAVYYDEVAYSGKSGAICQDCHTRAGALPRPHSGHIYQYRIPIINLSLMELMAVILILGLWTAVAIPPILRFKEQG